MSGRSLFLEIRFQVQRTSEKQVSNTSRLVKPDYEKFLQRAVKRSLYTFPNDPDSQEQTWSEMSKFLYDVAASVLGYARKQNVDWFGENSNDIKLAIEKRN